MFWFSIENSIIENLLIILSLFNYDFLIIILIIHIIFNHSNIFRVNDFN